MAKSKWISFGAQQPLERPSNTQPGTIPPPSTSSHPSPSDAKKFGFENFANICYANSVLQTLYFCAPFRDLLLQDAGHTVSSSSSPLVAPTPDKPPPSARRKSERKVGSNAEQSTSSQGGGIPIPPSAPTLYSALQSLFLHISTSPGDKGTVAPRAFIDKLKELNELFRSTMHQDAHEFLNYLLNQIVEEIEMNKRNTSNTNNGEDLSNSIRTLGSKSVVTTVNSVKSESSSSDASLVHKLFEGVLTSETRCLTCETVSCRDESFLDLSIDIDQRSSLTACLRQFSASEMLCHKNKFFCDSCCDLQEAEKRMKIKKLPNVLALHLKRFKYQEDVGRYIKLTYRVAFPLELRLFNTVDDLDDADRLYNLFAIVVHIGNGPHHGHYISIIKTTGSWFVFDDDNVSPIPESDIPRYFGDSNSGSAYILYYEAADIDLLNLGLRSPESQEANVTVASDKPQNSSQHSPAVPPGLESVSTSDLPLLPRHFPAENSPLPTTPGLLTIPQSSDTTPQQGSPNPTPLTPTSLGRQIMNTIRRAPSMSATRPPTITMPNGNDKKSLADKSPRLSASSTGFISDSSHEVPPPVPPLPPNILASPPHSSPAAFAASVSEPQKEEKGKEREKSRTGGNWFSKKRKSLRLGDKGGKHEAILSQVPPSPFIVAEDSSSHFQPQHTGWFNRSNSSTAGSKSQTVSRTGTSFDTDPRVPGSSTQDHRPYGLEDFLQPSRSSSPSGSSLLTTGQGLVGGTTAELSPSIPTSSVIPDHPQTGQKRSFTAPVEQSRSGVDQKKGDSKFPYQLVSSPEHASDHHPLPPLPLNRLDSHRPLRSNGYIPASERDMTPVDKMRAMEGKPLTPLRHPAGVTPLPPPVSRSSTLPHASPHVPQDSNSFNHSHDSRPPPRKLSLTTPILAFSRKDREREKIVTR